MNKQKVISLFLALAMLLSTGTALASEGSRASPVAAFTDCDPNAWYVPAIAYAVDNGIMEGVGDGQMAPDRTITRAEFVTMICRLLDARVTADISQYEDVPDNAWYRDFMAMGLKLGIVQGVSPTRLDPMGTLTREQAVVILARVLALSGGNVGTLDKYTDKSEISDWAVDAVRAMTAAERLRGYPDGTLRPGQDITRAETAQLLMNCFPVLTTAEKLQSTPYGQDVVLLGNSEPQKLAELQVAGTLILSPGTGDSRIDLRDCKVERLVCWGGRDIYIYPDCSIGEVIVARTDGPCTIHWLGTAATLPKVIFTEDSHPDVEVVDQDNKPFPDPDTKPEVSVDNRPKVYFIPQINGSTTSYGKPIGKDGIIQPMEPPTWEGRVFGGWYTEPECEMRFSFTQPVAKGMRLYGKWYTDAEWAAIDQLNAAAGQGMARIQCETELLATIGTDKLPCYIHSNETNTSPLRVELIREDTGEVVAVIDRLAPGETATEMSVTAMPWYGNYDATLVFRDAEGVRQAELQATLYVAYLWNRGE